MKRGTYFILTGYNPITRKNVTKQIRVCIEGYISEKHKIGISAPRDKDSFSPYNVTDLQTGLWICDGQNATSAFAEYIKLSDKVTKIREDKDRYPKGIKRFEKASKVFLIGEE